MSQGEKEDCREFLLQSLLAIGFDQRTLEVEDDRLHGAMFWGEWIRYVRRGLLRRVGLRRCAPVFCDFAWTEGKRLRDFMRHTWQIQSPPQTCPVTSSAPPLPLMPRPAPPRATDPS